MKKNDRVETPRFGTVKIQKVFRSSTTAEREGFTEPTHYRDSNYYIRGKSIGINRMIFAGIKK